MSDLKKNFNAFVLKNKNKIGEGTVIYSKEIDIATAIIGGIAQFAIYKKPIFLIEGISKAIFKVGEGVFYPHSLFSIANGYESLTYNNVSCASIFSEILKNFNHKPLKFNYEKVDARLIKLPFATIGFVDGDRDAIPQVYFKPSEVNKDVLIKFLVNELIKSINSNYFSVDLVKTSNYSNLYNIKITPEEFTFIESEKSKKYCDYIKLCLSKNIKRAFCFYGPPGTGKTTLSQTIVKNLNFRTLKFKNKEDGFSFELLTFIIKTMNVEAVIIDDFDISGDKERLLEFLEFLKKNVKVVITIANVMDNFHPAILRPGRTDEIDFIDCMDEEVIKDVLGSDLYLNFGSKVKNWPIAYIEELSTRNKIGIQSMDDVFKELDERVFNQIKLLKTYNSEKKQNER